MIQGSKVWEFAAFPRLTLVKWTFLDFGQNKTFGLLQIVVEFLFIYSINRKYNSQNNQ